MNAAPFYIFTGILGLVVGALVVWLLMAEHPFEALETPGGPVDDVEAGLLTEELKRDGVETDEAVVRRLLELHGAYVEGKIKEAQRAADAARIETNRKGRLRTGAGSGAEATAAGATGVEAPADEPDQPEAEPADESPGPEAAGQAQEFEAAEQTSTDRSDS